MTEAVKQEKIEDARRVLDRANRESQRIAKAINESRRVREEATKVLRRAGYNIR